jgi:hypothetical protein
MKAAKDLKKLGIKISKSIIDSLPESIAIVEMGQPIPHGVLPENCILMIEGQDSPEIIPYMFHSKIRHAVHVTRADFEKEINLAVEMITKPQNFMGRPLHHISAEKRCAPQLKIDFTSMDEKSIVLDKFSRYLDKVGDAVMLKHAIVNMVDELFTNALYNAPTDENGNRLNHRKERTDKVALNQVLRPQLSLYHNGNMGLICCKDPYGSLDLEKLLGRLSGLYLSEKKEVNMGPGGAGVAYHMMLESSSGLYIAVEKNKSTVVCFTLHLGEGIKKSEAFPKNLHFLSY